MDYDYILYVDESGDPGLRNVKPLDPQGASEWMMLSGALIAAHREQEMRDRITDLRKSLRNHYRSDIHFSDINPAKKTIVCGALASWPVRGFVICSNKQNMKGRDDLKPEANIVQVKSWFYAWLFRLLMERVSKWVFMHSMTRLGRPGVLKVELSSRGGIRYIGMRAYCHWLKETFSCGVGALPQGTIKWEVIDIPQIRDYPHKTRAGLQMADWIAGAFFKAADIHSTGALDSSFAKLLKPRMAFMPGHPQAGFGVKLMPRFNGLNIAAEQMEIFRHYGYPNYWWE
ncbi:DUF3800 domain-containing protein [Roseovarius sp.]|uniref:DUF3800 domain-containing protein n=1 Tax=Roseovarius sp. TaxID=1486281 RepID=UPI003A97B46C